jgi:hypothetical protein
MEKKTNKKKVDKKILTFFLIAFPTLLIIALSMLTPDAWWANIILAFYQFVLLKQFLDNYYDLLE